MVEEHEMTASLLWDPFLSSLYKSALTHRQLTRVRCISKETYINGKWTCPKGLWPHCRSCPFCLMGSFIVIYMGKNNANCWMINQKLSKQKLPFQSKPMKIEFIQKNTHTHTYTYVCLKWPNLEIISKDGYNKFCCTI